MKKYEWYLFDLDNTIIDFNNSSKNAFKETLKHFSIDFSKEIYNIYCDINSIYWQKLEAGKINSETLRIGRFNDFLKEIDNENNPKEMSENYLSFLVKHSKEINGAFAILEKLSKKHKLALVTNGLSDVQHKRIKKFNLKSYFKHIFISDEIGFSKPNNRFFEIVHKKINLPIKENVIVLGDNPYSDIIGANNFGYHSLYFNYTDKKTSIFHNYTVKNWKEFSDLQK